MNRLILLLGMLVCCLGVSFGQSGRDHPLFRRINNYKIVNHEQGQDVLNVPLSNIETSLLEGKKTFINYALNEGGGRYPNYQQLVNYYAGMVREKGGKQIFGEDNYGIYTLEHEGNKVWLIVEGYQNGREYSLTVLETEKIEDDTKALLTELIAGNITLYIKFESGKTELPADSKADLARIAKLMKKYPRFVISIEGHTDNVGKAEDNKKLSEGRASAVMKNLADQGVESKRMYAVGWGSAEPVASNDTEAGRKQNRRVEIIKIN